VTLAEHGEVALGLRVTQDDERVQTWWLCNEARRNAVTPAALRWIAARAPGLAGEIVVLRGAGAQSEAGGSTSASKPAPAKAFCAGFDLTALIGASASADAGDDELPDASLVAATAAMHRADATFVAALDGYAIGAGVELACACDLRLCVRGAFFAVPAAELGVVYHAAGLAALREAFGPAGARRLLVLGERLSAEDAWSAGALVRLCEPEAFEAELADVLGRLRRAAPLSLRGNRDLLRRLDHGPLPSDALQEHEARRRAAYASEDHHEARSARQEGRTPRFRGR
jgi:enoyl-CoA hydratase/carnithine racemase